MRIDDRRTSFAAPVIIVLTSGQPRLTRLACAKAHGGLTADAAVLIRQRVADGFYDSGSVADTIARAIAQQATT